MLSLYVHIHTLWLTRDEEGQASAEYALVLLGAAAVALLVSGWATHTNLVGKLLDSVMGKLLSQSQAPAK